LLRAILRLRSAEDALAIDIIKRGKNDYYEKENYNQKEIRAKGEEDFEVEGVASEEEGCRGEEEGGEA